MTGCSWDVAGVITDTSESTPRRRRDDCVAALVCTALVCAALSGYGRISGLELGGLAVDGSSTRRPPAARRPVRTSRPGKTRREVVGCQRRPRPRCRRGVGAGQRERRQTARRAPRRPGAAWSPDDVGIVHLDRGDDSDAVREAWALCHLDPVIPKVRPHGPRHSRPKKRPVARANSRLSQSGQLRRHTDRFSIQRAAALAPAMARLITMKLVQWAKQWND